MFNFFKKNKEGPKDLKEALGYLKKLDQGLKKLNLDLEDFKEKSKKSVQRVGMVRFNPFAESGGDQSFSIALLDENNDGIVMTSHYGREFNRIYAKPIKNGRSEYSLSKEEEAAIEKAIKNR